MTSKAEVPNFLVPRRPDVTLAQAGLPDFRGKGRVPGLRREEVAMLAGVVWTPRYAPESVLYALARTQVPNDVEHEYLMRLARPASLAAGQKTPSGVRTCRRGRPRTPNRPQNSPPSCRWRS